MLPDTAAAAELRRLMAPAPAPVALTPAPAAGVSLAPSRMASKAMLPDPGATPAAQLKGWQREVATARAGVLRELDLMAEEIGSEAGRERLVAQSRTAELPARLADLVATANRARGHLSHTTLKRWRKQLQKGGLDALAPAARERGERVPSWAPTFLKLYQTPQKRALAEVVKDLHQALPAGVERPSVAQVRRWYRGAALVQEGLRGRPRARPARAERAEVGARVRAPRYVRADAGRRLRVGRAHV
jgi:hypothetical protein